MSQLLSQTKEQYNNTDFLFKLSNSEGNLKIDPKNTFLRDAIRYSSSGCGSWKAKTKNVSISTYKAKCNEIERENKKILDKINDKKDVLKVSSKNLGITLNMVDKMEYQDLNLILDDIINEDKVSKANIKTLSRKKR